MPLDYPDAVDPAMVGEYSASAKSGGGYFFDHVLEYRVWCHPEKGAPDNCDGDDYYFAFATYAQADQFSQSNPGTEEPLVLVRQLEWIDEPETGKYIHEKGERITEWRTEWLAGNARGPGDIELFIQSRHSK